MRRPGARAPRLGRRDDVGHEALVFGRPLARAEGGEQHKQPRRARLCVEEGLGLLGGALDVRARVEDDTLSAALFRALELDPLVELEPTRFRALELDPFFLCHPHHARRKALLGAVMSPHSVASAYTSSALSGHLISPFGPVPIHALRLARKQSSVRLAGCT